MRYQPSEAERLRAERLRQARLRMRRALINLRRRLPASLRRMKRALERARIRLRRTLWPRLKEAWAFIMEMLDEGWATFLEILDVVVRGTSPAYPLFFFAWIFRNDFWTWIWIAVPGIGWCIFALCVMVIPKLGEEKENACQIMASVFADLKEIGMLRQRASQAPPTPDTSHTLSEEGKT